MANISSGPFYGSRLKIERAKQHISDLNTVLQTFIEAEPYAIVVEQDPNSTNHNWTIRGRAKFPDAIPAILGDAIHNLRTALDFLATDLVRPHATEQQLQKVYFPFAEHPNDLDGRIILRHVDLAGPDVVNLIKGLKPYPGGNQPLYGLHRLDIADKHTSAIATTHMAGIPDLQITGTAGPILMMKDCRFGPLKDGAIPMSLPPAENVKIGAEFIPAIHVIFGRGQPFEYEPIIPTLHQLTELVSGIMESLMPYAR